MFILCLIVIELTDNVDTGTGNMWQAMFINGSSKALTTLQPTELFLIIYLFLRYWI